MMMERNRVLVVSSQRPDHSRDDTVFVGTPLDLISLLETDRNLFGTVVLTGRFAANRELTSFLAETYPMLQVLYGRPGEEPDPYLPAYS